MIYLVVLLALLAQSVTGLPVYTTPDVVGKGQIGLALPNGHFAVALGPGCEGITVGMNAELLAGSGGVGALRTAGSDTLCNIYFEGPLSDDACLTNAEGACDVALEED